MNDTPFFNIKLPYYFVREMNKSFIGEKIKVIKSIGLGILNLNKTATFNAAPSIKKIEKITIVFVSLFLFNFGMKTKAITAVINSIKIVIIIDYSPFGFFTNEFSIVPNPCVFTCTSTLTGTS